MQCNVTYMSGAGNLFTVLHATELAPNLAARHAQRLCDASRTLGRNTEGVLVLDATDTMLTIHFFNPDGSSGMMCGNGARCAVRFALDTGILDKTDTLTLCLAEKHYQARLEDGIISIAFPPPHSIEDGLTLDLDGLVIPYAYADVGSDHVVIAQHDWERVANTAHPPFTFDAIAPHICHHSQFPRGVNVNLYTVQNDTIHLITYERGVEAITGACGTGAIATAAVAWRRGEIASKTIPILPPSGELLTVSIVAEAQTIRELSLGGPARILGSATVELPDIQ